jgi:hypothetical protein
VKKTVNKALNNTKKDDEHKHLKEAAVAVPAVALIIAGVLTWEVQSEHARQSAVSN